MTYEEAICYLENACTFGIKPGLMRIHELLERLGNPQNRYKTVHITGTNGKGSVTALIANGLTAAGRKTGRYTSPHLETYTERMSVDGREISREDFAAVTEKISRAVEAMKAAGTEQPTEFEMLTAMAFLYFAEQDVAYAVIEVGMGGLLDSTNVILPVVSVITNVALDHTAYCGTTVEEIARHKAGIIKDGVPVITAADGAALDAVAERAAAKGAPLCVLGKDIAVTRRSLEKAAAGELVQHLRLRLRGGKETSLELPLLGEHQADNCAVAAAALQYIGTVDGAVTDRAVREGIRTVSWPGRFQVVRAGGKTVVIDGAHNPAGIETFCRTFDEVFGEMKRVFVFSVLADKEYRAVIKRLFRSDDKVFCAPAPSPRTADPAFIAGLIGPRAATASSPAAALVQALAVTGADAVCCVVGSLYMQGDIRRCLRQRYAAAV